MIFSDKTRLLCAPALATLLHDDYDAPAAVTAVLRAHVHVSAVTEAAAKALYYLFYDVGEAGIAMQGQGQGHGVEQHGAGQGQGQHGAGQGPRLTVMRARALARGVVEALLVALAGTLAAGDGTGAGAGGYPGAGAVAGAGAGALAGAGGDIGACVEAVCGALASVTDR